jgi:hypothetical protein
VYLDDHSKLNELLGYVVEIMSDDSKYDEKLVTIAYSIHDYESYCSDSKDEIVKYGFHTYKEFSDFLKKILEDL